MILIFYRDLVQQLRRPTLGQNQSTGGTFALVPLLFPDRPGIAAGFIGGISTVGGIAYPLIFASVNAHAGYLYVALYMFAPFILFYFWAARYERHPQEHGLLGRALIGQRF